MDAKELMDYQNALQQIEDQKQKIKVLKKGLKWVLDEYIKCVNDSDEITEKLQELINT